MDLSLLGLNTYEQKTYLALLKLGTNTAKAIAKESKVPQSKIYDVLYGLADEGFITMLALRPKQFRAVSPRKAITGFVQEREKELKEVERLAKQLGKLKQKGALTTDEKISIHKGRKAHLRILMERYKTAKKELKELFTFEYCPPALLREIAKAVKRGVVVKHIATKNGPEQQKLIKAIQRVGAQIRYYPVEEIRISIKDGEQALETIVNPHNPDDRTSIIIDSQELTRALEHYFDAVWAKAVPP